MSDAHAAADLAHDVYMRLLARDDVIEAREPRAFLTTVAQRVLSNHRRREKLEQDYLAALAHVPQAMELSPEERAILLEALIEIDRRLDKLPLVVRRTFLLVQIDGLGHSEVAERLGVSVTSVKRYMVKAVHQCYFGDAEGDA